MKDMPPLPEMLGSPFILGSTEVILLIAIMFLPQTKARLRPHSSSRFRPRVGVVHVLPFLGNTATTHLGLCLWSAPEGHSEGSLFDGLRLTGSNTSACRLWSGSAPSQASAGWLFR